MQDSILVLNQKSSIHWARKIWHSGMGSIGLLVYAVSPWKSHQWGLILISLSIITFIFELIRLKSPPLNALFCKIMAPLLRTTERDAPTGLPYYALGVGLTALLFDTPIALLSTCYLVYADPIASLVGVQFGKTKFWNNRSAEGTLAFFNVALILNLLFFALGYFPDNHHLVVFSFLCAISAALSEVMSIGKYLDDNLVVPLASGIFITIWNSLL